MYDNVNFKFQIEEEKKAVTKAEQNKIAAAAYAKYKAQQDAIEAAANAKYKAQQDAIEAAEKAKEEKRRKNREYALKVDTIKAKKAYKDNDIEYLREFINDYAADDFSLTNTCTRTRCANIIKRELNRGCYLVIFFINWGRCISILRSIIFICEEVLHEWSSRITVSVRGKIIRKRF